MELVAESGVVSKPIESSASVLGTLAAAEPSLQGSALLERLQGEFLQIEVFYLGIFCTFSPKKSLLFHNIFLLTNFYQIFDNQSIHFDIIY